MEEYNTDEIVNNETGNILTMTNDTKEDETSELTLGKLLKHARNNKNLSLQAISRHTKISITNLEFLEADNIERLPNIAYVKGFVKSYSKIVNVDINQANTLLDDLYNISEPEPETDETISAINSSRETENATIDKKAKIKFNIDKKLQMKLAGASVVFLLLLVVVVINSGEKNNSVNEIERIEPVVEKDITVKKQVLTADTPLTKKEEISIQEKVVKAQEDLDSEKEVKVETPVKKADVEKKEVINEEPKPIAVKEETKETKKEEKSDEKEISFYAFPQPVFTYVSDSKEALEKYMPKNYQGSLEAGKQNVFVNAVDGDSWITYKEGSEKVKKFVLKQGRYVLMRGNEIRLFVGNIGAVKIFHNNQLLNVTSKSGVKSLIFPIDLSKETKLPLFIFNKDGSVQTSNEYLEAKAKASQD